MDQRDDIDRLDLVKRRYDAGKSFRDTRVTSWISSYKAYNNYVADNYPFRSRVFIPEIFGMVRRIYAKMILGFFQSSRIFQVVPEKGSDIENYQWMEMELDAALRRINFFITAGDWLLDCVIGGTGIFKNLWQRKMGVSWQAGVGRDPITNLEYTEWRQEPVMLEDDPLVVCRDPAHVYFDSKARPGTLGKWLIDEYEVDFDDLWGDREESKYRNLDEIYRFASSGEFDDYLWKRQQEIGRAIPSREEKRKLLVVKESWEDGRLITTACDRFIIRDTDEAGDEFPVKSGKIPYVVAHTNRNAREFYGRGLVEPILPMNLEINDLFNMSADDLWSSVYTMWRKDPDEEDITDEELTRRPSGVIHARAGTIEMLPNPGVNMQPFSFIDFLKRGVQDASSDYDYSRGATPERKELASVVMALQQAGSKGTQAELLALEMGGFCKEGEQIARLIQQFKRSSSEHVIPAGREKYESIWINPEQVQGKFKFKALGAISDIKEVRQKRIMQLIAELKEVPLPPGRINFLPLVREALESHEIRNIDEVLPEGQAAEVGGGGSVSPGLGVGAEEGIMEMYGQEGPFQAAGGVEMLGVMPEMPM